MLQNPAQRPPIKLDDLVEYIFRRLIEAPFLRFGRVAQKSGAHHRCESKGDDCRDQNCHAQCYGELAEQAPDNVAHEQKRNQNGDQRDGQRDDGEPNLLRSLQGSLERTVSLLNEPNDVLDHHDGVVNDKPGRNRQRHQGQIVEAVTGQIHHRESSDQRERDRNAGNHGR